MGRRGDPRSRERRPKSRNGNAPGRLLERRRNSTPSPAGTRLRRRGNSTAPPWDLDRAAVGTRPRRCGNGRPSARSRAAVCCCAASGQGEGGEAQAVSTQQPPLINIGQAVSLLHFSIFLLPRPSLFSAPVCTFQYPVPPTLLPLICNGLWIGV